MGFNSWRLRQKLEGRNGRPASVSLSKIANIACYSGSGGCAQGERCFAQRVRFGAGPLPERTDSRGRKVYTGRCPESGQLVQVRVQRKRGIRW